MCLPHAPVLSFAHLLPSACYAGYTLWGGTYLYGLHEGVPPIPPGAVLASQNFYMDSKDQSTFL